ncbi:hypothetical protein GOFOIKOB_4126 [Methylobacterium tardum]|jgi:hypothetical protein|uniref:Uncharacterized protein n=1 Tax=Methylobacterium tardum TaxID=374432 RepID=A0AA37TS93_9HYPH|nr:hypothetical protein [Methylobacterium tardum]URD37771.1 hypothetical protein M6G65_04275 [Methylobacterium tardum]GJE51071.1 hypothetical protein GOFOIKOB_4126 [Methylobacterium tardum]GLS73338.1 hypothetical protein GCM10007890_53530 [Methylobacterium tardum]
MSRSDRSLNPTKRRYAVRLPRPRAGAAATGLFLAALALSAATVPLVEPADATTSHGTAQAALSAPAAR